MLRLGSLIVIATTALIVLVTIPMSAAAISISAIDPLTRLAPNLPRLSAPGNRTLAGAARLEGGAL
jgi:hypothetical protein